MANVEGQPRIIITLGISVRLGGDGRPVYRDRSWNSRGDHIHLGSGSERKTREGRVVRYLDEDGYGVKGVRKIQEEDKGKGFPW